MKMLIASLLLCLSTVANSATLQGNPDNCTALMSSVLDATGIRDAGMPWEVAQGQLEDAIQRAMGKENSIVQDADDAAMIRRVFEDMWTKGEDGLDAALSAFNTCMGL